VLFWAAIGACRARQRCSRLCQQGWVAQPQSLGVHTATAGQGSWLYHTHSARTGVAPQPTGGRAGTGSLGEPSRVCLCHRGSRFWRRTDERRSCAGAGGDTRKPAVRLAGTCCAVCTRYALLSAASASPRRCASRRQRREEFNSTLWPAATVPGLLARSGRRLGGALLSPGSVGVGTSPSCRFPGHADTRVAVHTQPGVGGQPPEPAVKAPQRRAQTRRVGGGVFY
jgi:hypothetical protein